MDSVETLGAISLLRLDVMHGKDVELDDVGDGDEARRATCGLEMRHGNADVARIRRDGLVLALRESEAVGVGADGVSKRNFINDEDTFPQVGAESGGVNANKFE